MLGKEGRGTCDHFGVSKDVDLIMGTFSKSLASIGGFIAADKEVINYLRHNLVLTYLVQVTHLLQQLLHVALHIMKTEPERIKHLWDLTNYALKCFRDLGFEIGNTSTLLSLLRS